MLVRSTGNYHLITNSEWTTIGRDIESVNFNWNSTIVGSGFVFLGNYDGSAQSNASLDDADGYYGTGDNLTNCDGMFSSFPNDNVGSMACAGQRRTLKLSNNNIIWDFTGNTREWNNDTCDTSLWFNSGAFIPWTTVDLLDYEKNMSGSLNNYNSNNGFGNYYGCTLTGNPFIRSADDGSNGGLFYVKLNLDGSARTNVGFRCAYTP